MILESAVITATNADILAGTRLNSIPYNGTLTFDVLADLNNATNNYVVTIQEPNGDVPIDAQPVPGANPSLGGTLDERQLFRFSMPAYQGGHINIALTETGAAICFWRAVLRP